MARRNLSRPSFETRITRDVFIEMRDGVNLCVDLFVPDAEGKFPGLLAMSPYGKAKQSLPIPFQPPEAPLRDPTIESGTPDYFASRGYAFVVADSRGAGKSQGEYYGFASAQEGRDGHDIIEWMARQPWCNGKVGMTGISYFGTVQLLAAEEQPPHLVAIMPWNAPADIYRESTHHGGILQTFLYSLYQRMHARHTSLTVKGLSPEKLRDLQDALKRDSDIRMYPDLYAVVDNPDVSPSYFDAIAHPFDDSYYHERSAYTRYDRIKIPVYLSSGWWAYANMHLVGAFRHYMGIKSQKKLSISPKVFGNPLPAEYNEEALAWYDHWLKGIDTGIMDEPPIDLFVRGSGRHRMENEWPLARTKWTKFFLGSWGQLLSSPEDGDFEPDCFTQEPPTRSAEIQRLRYKTPPLGRDTEAIGPVALYFQASVDLEDTNWFASLIDDFNQGEGASVELSKGALKASHRELDPKVSTPWLPYHPHARSEPLVPGQVYEYAISLAPIANLFKAGHSIRIDITSSDNPHSLPRILGHSPPYHLCSSDTVTHKVYRGEKHQSYLLLPVLPESVVVDGSRRNEGSG